MSDEEEIDPSSLVDFSQVRRRTKVERAKLNVKSLANGGVFVDWTELAKHPSLRRFIIHWRSLNNNRSQAIRVSRKKRDFILQKLPAGHLYEIHVCSVNESNRVLASTAPAQVQTPPSDQAPTLRVTKLTPDRIWLEWEKSNDIQLSQVRRYRLLVNGEETTAFPSSETRFVVNDGEIGERYLFQVKMIGKDRRAISSIPVSVRWPGVTLPKQQVFVNGNNEVIITWGESTSISDGSIESYTVYLYDSDDDLLSIFGPNSPDCRQVWIKDLAPGTYFYVLEIRLANSTRSIYSKRTKVECGQETIPPVLTCEYAGVNERKRLTDLAYHLIQLRDSVKSRGLVDKCDDQLQQILSMLMQMTDSIRLNLMIESPSKENALRNHQLIIDDRKSATSIPWFIKEFPLELPRREKPYELAVALVPDQYETISNKVLVEASGHFSCFCAHFAPQQPITSCSYLETFRREKQLNRRMHQGLLPVPQTMKSFQVYDLRANRIVRLPPLEQSHRLSIILFYLNGCVPSMGHLTYFSTYASSHRRQHNYTSINCSHNDLDALTTLTEKYQDIESYTDFASEQFRYERNENGKSIPELLSIDGVPTYFVLDFSGRIVWRGRLCVQNQSEYDAAVDYMITSVNQLPRPQNESETDPHRSSNEKHVEAELNHTAKLLQSIVRRRSAPLVETPQQESNSNRNRQIASMKKQ